MGFLVKALAAVKTRRVAEASFSLYFLLLFLNLGGLAPLGRGYTPIIGLIFGFAGILFVAPLLSASIADPSFALSQLVPGGSPLPLSPALALIEGASLLIRPLTLRLRLVADMRRYSLLWRGR